MPVPSGQTDASARDQAKPRPAFPPVRKEFPSPEQEPETDQTWTERLARFAAQAKRFLTGIPKPAPLQPDSARSIEGRSESQYFGAPTRPFRTRSVQARALRVRSE
ncbi:hypothetical protein [Neptunicoccus sediminis]|uniref:hypothetical protein n=1 Tax=Neptunicoccus sediminis TaxID=1892596 RepID=UPI000845DC1F|nr:hypothetical protein [Neptunicoccus sediminis]